MQIISNSNHWIDQSRQKEMQQVDDSLAIQIILLNQAGEYLQMYLQLLLLLQGKQVFLLEMNWRIMEWWCMMCRLPRKEANRDHRIRIDSEHQAVKGEGAVQLQRYIWMTAIISNSTCRIIIIIIITGILAKPVSGGEFKWKHIFLWQSIVKNIIIDWLIDWVCFLLFDLQRVLIR